MPELAFAVPGDLATPTGGYVYARKLLELLPGEGFGLRHLALPGSFPHPTPTDLAEAARQLGSLPAGMALLVDGLAFGAFDAEALASLPRPLIALVHHPLAHEAGLSTAQAAALRQSERVALARPDRVIATSRFTARTLAEEYGVAPERITVAPPGTEAVPRAHGTGSPVALLAVGAVTPRKGFELMVDALAEMRDLDWRLTIAGALDRDPVAVARLREAIASAGLEGRIRLAGGVTEDELARLYDEADLFVSPSLYEGYGMALADALARGLPVVASTGGAAEDLLPEEGAKKVPPGDVLTLRAALRELIREPEARGKLAEGAWAAGQALPRWSDTAARVADALREALR